MAVSVMSFQKPQEPKGSEKEQPDVVDQILRGLQIASGIYGIKHNITQDELNQLKITQTKAELEKSQADASMAKDPSAPGNVLLKQELEAIGSQIPEGATAQQLGISSGDLLKLKAAQAYKPKSEIDELIKAAKLKSLETTPGLKQDVAARKAEEKSMVSQQKEATLAIPEYDISKEVRPQAVEAKALRSAVSDAKTLNGLINEAAELAKGASTFELANPLSDVRNQIQNKLKQAQLLYKGEAFAKLGVLAGPDMQILDAVIENPITASSLAKGKEGVISRLSELTKTINSGIENKLQTSGYVRKQKAESAPSVAPTVVDYNALQQELIKRKGLAR